MNAKRTQNADTKTMGDKTQRSVLDGDVVATRQSSGSRASNGRAKKLLADTDTSKTTKTKTRRTEEKKG